MPEIDSKDLIPGMRLESDIKDESGRILLRAGQRISESKIRVVNRMNIPSVNVHSEFQDDDELSVDLNDQAPAGVTAELDWEAQLDRRFREVMHERAMRELRDIIADTFFADEDE
jgi:hypothetical protein